MSEKFQSYTVQNLIGYNFKDTNLLISAFTHSSSANKGQSSNQQLIFLGKAVCELLVRDYLYSNLMVADTKPMTISEAESQIGALTQKCSLSIDLNEYMIISDHAEALRSSQVTREELFLAISGAIYKDGGMPSVRAFVLPKLRLVISSDAPRSIREMKNSVKQNATESRAPFSDTSVQNEKKASSNPFKNLFSSRKKKSAEEQTESKAISQAKTESTNIKTEPTVTAPQTPTVATSLSMEKPPRKVPKAHSPSEAAAQANKTIAEPSDGNYKSALQEYVQKNIRSATVMLEYKDTKTRSGCTVRVYLFGKLIAEADGNGKKDASQSAAQKAYNAILTEKSEANVWFKKLKADPEQATVTMPTDYISKLNCAFQKKYHRSDSTLTYETKPSKNKRSVTAEIYTNGKLLGIGEGKNAKEAKQNAAKEALSKIDG